MTLKGFQLSTSDLSTDNIKKTLLNFIRFYHPDKQKDKKVKEYYLYREIAKYLNGLYD